MIVFQTPNAPAIVAILGFVFSWALGESLVGFILALVGYAALIVWSYQEVVDGVSWVRRVFGVIGFVIVAVGLSKLFGA